MPTHSAIAIGAFVLGVVFGAWWITDTLIKRGIISKEDLAQ